LKPKHHQPARANVPARGAAARPRPHAAPEQGIRFAPEMIAAPAIMPHILFPGEKPMTAYLISLALIGLIAVAVLEGCS
jgi:hypothetical protein